MNTIDAISMQVSHSKVRNRGSVKRMPKREWSEYLHAVVPMKGVSQHLRTMMFLVEKDDFVLTTKNQV